MPGQRGKRAALLLLLSACAASMATIVDGARGSHAAYAAPEQGVPGVRALALEWAAPASCPGRDDVLARVDELLESSPTPHRQVSARGVVTESASKPRYRLELVVVGNDASRRSLSGEDCSHLVDAAALILALDIDPEALTRRENEPTPHDAGAPTPGSPVSTVGDASVDAAPRPPLVAAAPTTKPATERTRVELSTGARVVLDVGSLPRTTGGIGGALAMSYRHFVLELAGTAYERRFTVDGPREGRAGAWVGLVAGSAHGCYRRTVLEVDWRACVGGELGRESTTGVNLLRTSEVSGLWSAASAMLLARALPRSAVTPVAGFSVVVPIGSPPVLVDNFGTLFDPSAVVLRFMLGLDANFF